jgi:hypothetical protein
MKTKRDELSSKMNNLKNSSDDVWKNMSAGIDKALEEIDASY